MPTYIYRCEKCEETTEHNAKMGQAPKHVTCSNCGSQRTRRVILTHPNMRRVLTSLGSGSANAH